MLDRVFEPKSRQVKDYTIGIYCLHTKRERKRIKLVCLESRCDNMFEWSNMPKWTDVSELGVRVVVFNPTFNNLSVISLRSDLLLEETGESEKTLRPVAKSVDKLYYIILYRVHLTRAGFELTIWVVKGTDCIGSCKLKYLAITITTAPLVVSELVQYKSNSMCWSSTNI